MDHFLSQLGSSFFSSRSYRGNTSPCELMNHDCLDYSLRFILWARPLCCLFRLGSTTGLLLSAKRECDLYEVTQVATDDSEFSCCLGDCALGSSFDYIAIREPEVVWEHMEPLT